MLDNHAIDCETKQSEVKNYQYFAVKDFSLDEYFQSWVLTPDESNEAFWRSWLQENPDKFNEVVEAREILLNFNLIRYTLPSEDVSGLWKRIQGSKEIDVDHPLKKHQGRNYRWYWVAAAIVLMGVAIPLIIQRDSGQLEYQTEFGETKTVLLPDSSTVILNANSRITFNKDLDKQLVRDIWLEGEAFFSVVHKQDNQPFKVSTPGGVAVEVMGTTFDVYSRSIDTKVVLNTGQIRLSLPSANKEENKILMKPGELVEYNKDQYSKRVVDPRIYAAWTQKKIILNQTTLQEMIRMAKDNYGLEIDVESEKMLLQSVSGSMPLGDKENFVSQVSKVFHLTVVRDGDKYLLKE